MFVTSSFPFLETLLSFRNFRTGKNKEENQLLASCPSLQPEAFLSCLEAQGNEGTRSSKGETGLDDVAREYGYPDFKTAEEELRNIIESINKLQQRISSLDNYSTRRQSFVCSRNSLKKHLKDKGLTEEEANIHPRVLILQGLIDASKTKKKLRKEDEEQLPELRKREKALSWVPDARRNYHGQEQWNR